MTDTTGPEMRRALELAREWIAWTDWLLLNPAERVRLGEEDMPKLSDLFDEMDANQAINVVAKALLAANDEAERMRAVYEAARDLSALHAVDRTVLVNDNATAAAWCRMVNAVNATTSAAAGRGREG